jgi:hypothetical protein
MAKIKIRIDSLESVSEEMQGFYQADEVNGGFVLQADTDSTGLGIGPLSSLRGKLEESQRKESKVKNMLLKKDDESLWTSSELDAMVQELTSMKEANATLTSNKAGSEDILKQQIAAAKGPIQEENNKLRTENDKFRKSVYDAEGSRLVDKVVKEMNPSPEWEDLMRQELTRHVQVDEVDGAIRSQFIDPATGTVRFSSERENDGPMSHKEFANLPELQTKYAKCLQGDGKVGANIDDANTNKFKADSQPKKGNRDVMISKTDANDFAAFVAASEMAKAQGGQVLISDE